MWNDHGFCSFREAALHIRNADIEGFPFNVGNDRCGTHIVDRIEKGRTDIAGDDHLITLPDA